MKKIFHLILVLLTVSHFTAEAQTVNINFESTAAGAYTASNAVSGWTISSQTSLGGCSTNNVWTPGSAEFSIVTTPVLSFPILNLIPNSPLGGTNVARLNNSTANTSSTRLSRTFTGFPANSQLQFAIAGIWTGSHSCCDQGGYKILIRDVNGTELGCLTSSFTAIGSSCVNSGSTYSIASSGESWSNWQTRTIDMSAFTASIITLEVIVFDCSFGEHYSTLFFDANITSYSAGSSFCAGSNLAVIAAPPGFSSYQWYSPSGIISSPQGTLQNLMVSTPVTGATYSVMMLAQSGCIFQATYAIVPTNVTISSVNTQSSCMGGSAGAATVSASGSGSGYTYTWTNSSNSVISNSASINNVPPGTYTVKVGALASSGCGTPTSVVTIGTSPSSVTTLLKPYCGNYAYLSAPTGTNYQWYSSTVAISAGSGGTAPSYTVTNPVNGWFYTLAFDDFNGCRDSIKYYLAPTPPGSLTIKSNLLACPNATNATAVFSLTPASGSPPGFNTLLVGSTGTTSSYVMTVSPTPANVFTANLLSAGGTYTVQASDGSCSYALNFSVTPYTFTFSAFPPTNTLCPGNTMAASVIFTTPPSPSQYSYSWSPSTHLFGSANQANVVVSPTFTPGVVTTMIYTVVVTPSIVNCPVSKTIAVTIASPSAPTISPIPALCANASTYQIVSNPPGGTYTSSTSSGVGLFTGIINPSQALPGTNTFVYSYAIGTCVASSTASYVIKTPPTLTISGNDAICEGQSTTLLANGGDTYLWNTSSASPFITVSPSVTTSYSVSGTSLSTNCSDHTFITVSVTPYPNLSITGNTSICAGQSATLAASGANSYNWSNGSGNAVNIVSPNSTTIYTVTGAAILPSCSSSQTVMVNVQNCTITQLNEHKGNEQIEVYPNPGAGQFFIKTGRECQLKLYDLGAKLLFETKAKNGTTEIDLSTYPKGIYFLDVLSSDTSKTLKLVKIE